MSNFTDTSTAGALPHVRALKQHEMDSLAGLLSTVIDMAETTPHFILKRVEIQVVDEEHKEPVGTVRLETDDREMVTATFHPVVFNI